MIETQGMRHVALRVADVERSKRFYEDVFGMRVVWQPDPDNAYLSSGSDNLALHREAGLGALSGHAGAGSHRLLRGRARATRAQFCLGAGARTRHRQTVAAPSRRHLFLLHQRSRRGRGSVDP